MEIQDIRDWSSTEIKTIAITQDVGGKSYNLKVREFIPVEGDALERRWRTGGVEQTFKCAPYAIADMKEAGRTLSHFADKTLESSICHYIDETDILLRSTYHMAYRYSLFAEVSFLATYLNYANAANTPVGKRKTFVALRF
jgi:hypothetical protein